jgi:tRNA dimethylallyltransferase
MQVYRGMDVGTAKPTFEERSRAVHHMVDVAAPWEEWSVARFQQAARAAVCDVERRGRRALLVGGTGLYFQAVVDDLRFPGEDLELRADLERATAEPGGVAAAYAELERHDPVAAARIDPHNVRRIVRALEVIRTTGEPFSSFGPGVNEHGATVFPVDVAGLWLSRDVAGERIEARFERMRRAGLVDEVRALAADPRGWSRSARQAIGYKEVAAYLDGAEPSLDAALATAVRRTRSFARRQRMWFRRDPRITWYGAARKPADVTPALLAAWGAP